MRKHYVYLLQSLSQKKRFYIGVTSNLKKRLAKHNNAGSPSTKPYRPWKIIYFEIFDDKYKAYKREYYLKHPKGYLEKKRIIEVYKIK